jgi:hypothetical protein
MDEEEEEEEDDELDGPAPPPPGPVDPEADSFDPGSSPPHAARADKARTIFAERRIMLGCSADLGPVVPGSG